MATVSSPLISDKRRNTFLGLDLSTQQLKAVVIDESWHTMHEASVLFDSELPEFRTHGGAITDKIRGDVVTAPTLMWVKAVDMLMDKLMVAGVKFSEIIAISGSAQQHGSVYWQRGVSKLLANLDATAFLHQQLTGAFTIAQSPIWMDSSTAKYCTILEETVGGAQELARITGSRAYERFTAAQIAKIAQIKPEAYKATERISLVSSFLCSLFLGRVAPMDFADASGMNMLDIRLKQWHEPLTNAIGEDLESKLGEPCSTSTHLGSVSTYFVERYDFSSDCSVISFTGDNPSSLVGMNLDKEWVAISLGTSDTIFLWLEEPVTLLNAHVLCHPVEDNAYMGMICFKNGSLVRERIRNACADGNWDIFNQLLDSTPRGNFGNMGLYFDVAEIAPALDIGQYRFNRSDERVQKFTSLEVEVRALVEGQFIARRAYAEDLFGAGRRNSESMKILATGGASVNRAILQVLADVFNAPVYELNGAQNSALLGAAYRAAHNAMPKRNDLVEMPQTCPTLVCQPFADAADIYDDMVIRFRKLVTKLLPD